MRPSLGRTTVHLLVVIRHVRQLAILALKYMQILGGRLSVNGPGLRHLLSAARALRVSGHRAPYLSIFLHRTLEQFARHHHGVVLQGLIERPQTARDSKKESASCPWFVRSVHPKTMRESTSRSDTLEKLMARPR
jgi:hypothetical protein